jgi:hypothetical protein
VVSFFCHFNLFLFRLSVGFVFDMVVHLASRVSSEQVATKEQYEHDACLNGSKHCAVLH